MEKEKIFEITLDYLQRTPFGQNLKKAAEVVQRVQLDLAALTGSDAGLTTLKAGTVLVMALAAKCAAGKQPKEFTREDWDDLARSVEEYAVRPSGAEYSVFVFNLYAQYLDQSVAISEKIGAAQETLDQVSLLAKQLREKTQFFQDGLIGEVDYTEDCLWLSLKGILLLLTAFYTGKIGEEYATLARNAVLFSVELARYMRLKQEQEVLARCLQEQKELDTRLQAEYQVFLDDLNREAQNYLQLVEAAFGDDLSRAFPASATLASLSGVEESEILKTEEDIDAFFLD